MAALDTPWIDPMSADYTHQESNGNDGSSDHLPAHARNNGIQPTFAAFSPDQQTASGRRTRTSVVIHQKSPLLMATPPQVTRALAYSHPFILPLNHAFGLLSWTTHDQWDSFLVVVCFWFIVLYGDSVIRWAAPLAVVAILVMAMYVRRYSPLSSTTWSRHKKGHRRNDSEQVRKTLDEIIETLQTFTARCDVLLDPFVRVTEFLSTQSTATSATTRPALTTLFVRILGFTPFWMALTLPPLSIITTKRLAFALGTLCLTWHSRPARVCRTVLWRSRTVRRVTTLITGLKFETPPPGRKTVAAAAGVADVPAITKKGKVNNPGVRFTFTIYENQRRWLGLGWTASLLAYERQGWTDEAQNACAEPQSFPLPETDMVTTKWRWVPGSHWHVEGSAGKSGGGKRVNSDEHGWVYSDNKWTTPSKEDGWGKYTRRRKWARDAELVEIDAEDDESSTISTRKAADDNNNGEPQIIPSKVTATGKGAVTTAAFSPSPNKSNNTTPQKRRTWLGRSSRRSSFASVDGDAVSVAGSTASTHRSTRSRDEATDDVATPLAYRSNEFDRRIIDGIAEGIS